MDERTGPVEDILQLYFRDLAEYEPLSREEEAELLQRAKKGDRAAIDKLIKHNLRFVVHIAKQYEGLGVPLLDLIDEGNLGLMRAIERFDPSKGVRFLTYAIWWIRQAILRAIQQQSRNVPIPREKRDLRKNIEEVLREHLHDTGEEPSVEEIARILNLPKHEVEKARDLVFREISLDTEVIPGEDRLRLEDLLTETTRPTPRELWQREEAIRRVREILDRDLDPREARILKMYFGIGYPKPFSLQEIGEEMHISRERVRQLKDRALRKLFYRYGHQLKELLESP